MKDDELDQIREQGLNLLQQMQTGLINFLGNELDLVDIFYNMRKSSSDLAHRAKLLGDMHVALATIRRFEGRIKDRAIWADIHRGADRLEKKISKISD